MKRIITFMMIIIALGLIGIGLKEYVAVKKETDKTKRLVKEVVSVRDPEEPKKPEGREINWKQLKEINPDIIGWIWISETSIDYPILQNKQEGYYLCHDYTGAYSICGSIFIEQEEDLKNLHCIIYGHHMDNGAFFGTLEKFEEESFAREHKVIIYTPAATYEYVPYTAYSTTDFENTYRKAEDTSLKEYLCGVKSQAPYIIPVQHEEEQRLLTLSTCTAQGGDEERFVIQCLGGKNAENHR